MVEKRVKLCDVCGQLAHVTLDLCDDHDAKKSAKTSRARRKACEYCGRRFYPQGLAAHLRTAHAEE